MAAYQLSTVYAKLLNHARENDAGLMREPACVTPGETAETQQHMQAVWRPQTHSQAL